MGQSKQPEYDKKELKNASELWEKFIVWSKYGTFAVVVVLILMAIFLL